MNNIFKPMSIMLLSILCLSACRTVVNEGYVSDEPEPGIDPGVRQVMMEEDSHYPEEEEGLIAAPSEYIHGVIY